MEEDTGDGIRSSSWPTEENVEMVESSLNSMLGLTLPGTMKIKGKLRTKEVIVLIDYGATHNFLSMELIEELKLPLLTMGNYVVMGTRMAVLGREFAKELL